MEVEEGEVPLPQQQVTAPIVNIPPTEGLEEGEVPFTPIVSLGETRKRERPAATEVEEGEIVETKRLKFGPEKKEEFQLPEPQYEQLKRALDEATQKSAWFEERISDLATKIGKIDTIRNELIKQQRELKQQLEEQKQAWEEELQREWQIVQSQINSKVGGELEGMKEKVNAINVNLIERNAQLKLLDSSLTTALKQMNRMLEGRAIQEIEELTVRDEPREITTVTEEPREIVPVE